MIFQKGIKKQMKSSSSHKQSDYQIRGPRAYIRWNHTEETKTDTEGKITTQWVCEEITVDKHTDRGSLIEAIIRTQYPDYGAELAAINNGGDDFINYQSFRDQAKMIADGFFNRG